MKLTQARDVFHNKTVYCLEIDIADELAYKPGGYDLELARECGESSSIADKLLFLEAFARNVEEQEKKRRGEEEE